jgi:phosphatidate cytidylyltransferase
MLRKRVLTAAWGIPLIIASVWFSGPEYSFPFFTVVVALWGLLAAIEFYRLTGVSGSPPLLIFGLIFTVLFIVSPHISFTDIPEVPFLLTLTVALSLVLLIFLPKKEGLFDRWAWMLGGILYAGWLLSLPVFLRTGAAAGTFPHLGRNLVFLALFATFGSDTTAYLIGTAIGRHKMAPRISPGKTWEGAVAGLLGAVVVTLLFTINAPWQLPLGYGQAVLLGLLISIFGQIGDLAESMLKRSAGAKESGSLLPGHGGLLDRMDSVVFAGVVVYLYYWLVVI